MESRVGDRLSSGWRQVADNEYYLIKGHKYTVLTADCSTILSYRDPIDTAASMARMGWPHDVEAVRHIIMQFRKWQADDPCFCFAYEAMVADPARMAFALLLSLGIDATKTEATMICREVDAISDWDGTSNQDDEWPHEAGTLMHFCHRAAGGHVGNRDGLPEELQREIEAAILKEGWTFP